MKLLHGDCLELMQEIPDGSIDMVLCDLPFGTTCNKWDEVIPFDPLLEQYHCICKANAAILLFGQMPFTAALVMSNPKEFRYEWIYEKTNATGFLNAKRMPMKAHENICVFYRQLPTYNPQWTFSKPYERDCKGGFSKNYNKPPNERKRESKDGRRFPIDVIKFNNSGKRGFHPTQKPVPLLEYLIKTYTNECDTVLDNCMGSGSTGVACVNTGRDFIGIELNAGYYDIACERIENSQEQLRFY